MKKNLAAIMAVMAVLGLAYYWLIYEDVRLPWQPETRFEREFPGCVAGILSGDYAALKLPTGFTHFYLGWGDNFPAAELGKSGRKNTILALTWEPYLKGDQEHSLVGEIAGGKHDAYMAAMAASLKKYGRPVLLSWGHEPGEDLYAGSGARKGSSPEMYKAAWRRMAGVMRAGAGPKVKLVFSMGAKEKPSGAESRFENYYPGPEYADAVGLDVYSLGPSLGWSSWRKPRSALKGPYSRALAMAPDKPMFLTGVATCQDGSSKAAWLTRLLRRLEVRYGAVKGFMWFDYNKECDWRLSSDGKASEIYRQAAADGYFKADPSRLNWFFGK